MRATGGLRAILGSCQVVDRHRGRQDLRRRPRRRLADRRASRKNFRRKIPNALNVKSR